MNYYIYGPYCPMIYSYQSSPSEHRGSYPLNMYYCAPHSYYDYRFYSPPVSPMIETEYYEDDYRADCNDAARINATMDYVNHNLQNQGFAGGTPNFHQARRADGELVYGVVFIKPGNAEVRDVVASTLDLPRYERIFCSQAIPDSTPAKQFPITTSQHTELGDHRRMETSIIISSNGRVDGRTKIWTSKKWQGFTGFVQVTFYDANGEVVDVDPAPMFQYGVEGTATGGHKREEPWVYRIPSHLINKVVRASILHSVRATPRITSQNFKEWSDVLIPLIKELKPTPQVPTGRYYLS